MSHEAKDLGFKNKNSKKLFTIFFSNKLCPILVSFEIFFKGQNRGGVNPWAEFSLRRSRPVYRHTGWVLLGACAHTCLLCLKILNGFAGPQEVPQEFYRP